MSPESYKEDGRPAQQWYWDDWFSAFDVRLCDLAARGLWIDMLGIMFKAEIRGTLTVNGKKINSKTLAKIVGATEAHVERLLRELERHDVFSRLGDDTIICRRMFRESGKKDEISKIRSEVGKKGAKSRWQKMANMATASSSASSSASSIATSNHKDNKTSLPEKGKNKTPQIDFSFEERKFLNIKIEDKAGWKDAYPVVDIDQELRIAREWLLANPSKRKSNYRQFINNWLRREQDKGGRSQTRIGSGGRPMTKKEEKEQKIDDWTKGKNEK